MENSAKGVRVAKSAQKPRKPREVRPEFGKRVLVKASKNQKAYTRELRRSFSPEYKLAILAEYDSCSETGEKGALLRREGLYGPLITDWRRQHREGILVENQGRGDGGRGGPSLSEVKRLRAENERLKEQLAKAQIVIEVQGKVHALLDEISKSANSDE